MRLMSVRPQSASERACQVKTSRGNVFDTQDEADEVARGMYLSRRVRVLGYRCPVCGLYHVGGTDRERFDLATLGRGGLSALARQAADAYHKSRPVRRMAGRWYRRLVRLALRRRRLELADMDWEDGWVLDLDAGRDY